MTRVIDHKSTSLVRAVGLGLAALLLANCAGTPRSALQTYRPAPAAAFQIIVNPGDTVSELALRYQVSAEDIVAINSLPDSHQIHAGAPLYVPAYGGVRPPDSTASAGNGVARPRAKPVFYQPGRSIDQTQLRPGTVVTRAGAPLAAPESNSGAGSSVRFAWPLYGRVLSTYGTSVNGERNDGINILTPRGTPIRAAASGTVTYVGNELKSYGNLLLIRHDDGFVTAYAHADSVSVRNGQKVRAGETIARSGATGDVSQPQLHFEIRQGTKPVDPAVYLLSTGSGQASLTPSAPPRS